MEQVDISIEMQIKIIQSNIRTTERRLTVGGLSGEHIEQLDNILKAERILLEEFMDLYPVFFI